MKKTKNITMVIFLITNLIIVVSIIWLFWCVLAAKNQVDYARHSDCLLYRNHSEQKITLPKANHKHLMAGTLQDFNHKFKEKVVLNDDDFAFIHRCENNMTYQASQAAINNFKQKQALNNFKTLTDVVKGVTNNQTYSYQFIDMVAAIDIPEQKVFRNNLVAIANLFVNIYGLPIFQKLWYNIEFHDNFIKNNTIDKKTLAVTKLKKNGSNLAQCMIVAKHALPKATSEKQYEIGFHSTSINISSIIHEMGHAISNYAWIWPNDRKYLNNNININTGKCSCDSNNSTSNVRAFMNNPNDLLVQYLGRKVGISDNAPFQQLLVAWSFIQSGYGRTGGNDELFAEGFAQWLLTPDKEKGLNWEALNEFFMVYFKNYYLI